jgi:hypothetical protein
MCLVTLGLGWIGPTGVSLLFGVAFRGGFGGLAPWQAFSGTTFPLIDRRSARSVRAVSLAAIAADQRNVTASHTVGRQLVGSGPPLSMSSLRATIGGRHTGKKVAAEPDIPLAEAIRALRRELVAAVAEGEGEEVRFALGPVELEVELAVTREAGGEAGIAFWLVSIGGKGSRTSARTHTVKLTLTPVRVTAEGEVQKDIVVGSELDRRPAGWNDG